MPLYEFECKQGHVTEKLVPIGTARVLCETCHPPEHLTDGRCRRIYFAKRILSPTPTTFVSAGGRKL